MYFHIFKIDIKLYVYFFFFFFNFYMLKFWICILYSEMFYYLNLKIIKLLSREWSLFTKVA